MKEKNKRFLLVAIAIMAMVSLTGCSSSTASTDSSPGDGPSLSRDQKGNDSNISTQDSQKSDNQYSSLSIGSGCIGCGHCIRFDPDHFKHGSGPIPEVISQENLDSPSLKMAINNCRVNAIVRGM